MLSGGNPDEELLDGPIEINPSFRSHRHVRFIAADNGSWSSAGDESGYHTGKDFPEAEAGEDSLTAQRTVSDVMMSSFNVSHVSPSLPVLCSAPYDGASGVSQIETRV